MRASARLGIAVLALLLAPAAIAQQFVKSPYLERIPHPGRCDVVVTPTNAATALARLNDPTVRVICVAPGDYRSFGLLKLEASGTQAVRRYLRFNTSSADSTTAYQRSERARFESLRIRGSWWVVQGLTVQPLDPATQHFITIDGGDHVVVDGCYVDASSHQNAGTQKGILIEGKSGDPATFNTVQRNVVRGGNRSNLPVDYHGILIRPGLVAGEHNDRNKILDNEVFDWGDGINIGASDPGCAEAMQRGNVIDGNDSYVTPAKYVNCTTGAFDPSGECACAENGIEIKSSATAAPEDWNRITNNRVWGHRPTSPAASCGGSGANGQSISAGNSCAAHVVVAKNIVSDSTIGILPASASWVVAGNLVHGIHASNGELYGSAAISAPSISQDLEIQFNTIVDVDSAYDPQSRDTDTRCNVIVENQAFIEIAANGRPADHVTRYNYLYDSPPYHFMGSTNAKYANAAESHDAQFCYWRKRWTNPQQVCVPYASTTAQSPHVAAIGQCNPDLLEEFDLERVSWPTTTPCSDGVDNDGDGAADAADVACAAGARREDPRCQNGVDDDGDGLVDFDGGRSANGGVSLGAPDPSCRIASRDSERYAECGLGFEAGVALTLIEVLRRRQRRGRVRSE